MENSSTNPLDIGMLENYEGLSQFFSYEELCNKSSQTDACPLTKELNEIRKGIRQVEIKLLKMKNNIQTSESS